MSDFKLKYEINADGKQAIAEIKKVDSALGSINTKSLSSTLSDAQSKFGSLTGAANAAAGSIPIAFAGAVTAVVGLGVAVAAVGAGFFDLAQHASESAGQMFDFQRKTGLSAAALSTLKLAADQSGSSFEHVTKGATKFGMVIGNAANGSKEAQKILKDLGVTSSDLGTALNQVFTKIDGTSNITDKLRLAGEAFGKKLGADMIPVIAQLGGSLKEATAYAEKMGLTLSEQDIQAAHDFGDSWRLLTGQIEAGAERFALAYAPQITEAIQEISGFLARNQAQWAVWGQTIGRTASNVT
ncbi:MAG: hypothetical protein ACRD43_05540, partial [Pyrinomonadaceae bacterium]